MLRCSEHWFFCHIILPGAFLYGTYNIFSGKNTFGAKEVGLVVSISLWKCREMHFFQK